MYYREVTDHETDYNSFEELAISFMDYKNYRGLIAYSCYEDKLDGIERIKEVMKDRNDLILNVLHGNIKSKKSDSGIIYLSYDKLPRGLDICGHEITYGFIDNATTLPYKQYMIMLTRLRSRCELSSKMFVK